MACGPNEIHVRAMIWFIHLFLRQSGRAALCTRWCLSRQSGLRQEGKSTLYYQVVNCLSPCTLLSTWLPRLKYTQWISRNWLARSQWNTHKPFTRLTHDGSYVSVLENEFCISFCADPRLESTFSNSKFCSMKWKKFAVHCINRSFLVLKRCTAFDEVRIADLLGTHCICGEHVCSSTVLELQIEQ